MNNKEFTSFLERANTRFFELPLVPILVFLVLVLGMWLCAVKTERHNQHIDAVVARLELFLDQNNVPKASIEMQADR